jgi:hypothetical protein
MDYLNTLRVRSGLGRTALEAECAMCAQFVEMHHIRSLKDLKGRVERVMIASNRKYRYAGRATRNTMGGSQGLASKT